MFINVGIDIGSESTKAVMLKDGKKIIDSVIVQKGVDSKGASEALFNLIKKSGIPRSQINQIITTGVGRYLFEEGDRAVSEISCQAVGVNFLMPSARTIIEIGGEDSKAIRIDANGNVRQYFLNDQCAVGTGRALDMMANILNVDISEFSEYDSRSKNVIRLRHRCPVFAQSEVIRLISRGTKKEDIIAGLHMDVAQKACGLIFRCGVEERIVMTGGVAQNQGVFRAIERELKRKISIAPNPQTICALGAAIYGYNELR